MLFIFNTFCMFSWDVSFFVGEGGEFHICIKHSSSNLWPVSSCVCGIQMTDFLSVKH